MAELKKTSNPAETAFIQWASKQGWGVHSAGWPDFLCFATRTQDVLGFDHDVIFTVEVKDGTRPERQLSEEQAAVMNLLERAGVKCYTWTPKTGLRRFGGQGAIR